MIIVQANGGLGNLLFQYAAGRSLALKHNTSLFIDFEKYQRLRDIQSNTAYAIINYMNLQCKSSFSTNSSYLNRIRDTVKKHKLLKKIFHKIVWHESHIYIEKNLAYDPSFLDIKNNSRLVGYFQSPKYFAHISDLIRKEFSVNDNSFGKDYLSLKDKIQSENSVAVHIRRGDYLKTTLHNVCKYHYFKRAMAKLIASSDNITFYIFSDDMDWCKKHFSGSNITFVKPANSARNVLVDFSLMKTCKHNIISNSSYSWWAAWLNQNKEKTVLIPDRWYNDPQSNQEAMPELAINHYQKIKPD